MDFRFSSSRYASMSNLILARIDFLRLDSLGFYTMLVQDLLGPTGQ